MWRIAVALRSLPHSRRIVLSVVLVSSIMLAGCNALSGQDTGSPTGDVSPVTTARSPSPTPTVTPTPAPTATRTPIPTDPPVPALSEKGVALTTVWNRTERVVGVNGTRPEIVVYQSTLGGELPRYIRVFTGSKLEDGGEAAAGYIAEKNEVILPARTLREVSAPRLKLLLAHEFAHALHTQHNWSDDPRTDTTELMAAGAYSEGFATFVTSEYAERYSELSGYRNWTRIYENGSTAKRYAMARYVYGEKYFERRVNETGTLSAAAADRPTTTEQILHDTDEPPRKLRIDTEYAQTNWSVGELGPARVERPRPRGELVTRVLLRDELQKSRAASAAEGWGADRLVRFESDESDAIGFVWVHRWDSPSEAAEFASAMATYLEDRRAETDEYTFALQRLTPETTVVVAGTSGFTNRTAITAVSNASVTVRIEG